MQNMQAQVSRWEDEHLVAGGLAVLEGGVAEAEVAVVVVVVTLW